MPHGNMAGSDPIVGNDSKGYLLSSSLLALVLAERMRVVHLGPPSSSSSSVCSC